MAAAPMATVEDGTATMAEDIMVAAGTMAGATAAITDGAAEVGAGAIQVMVGVGGWDSAGGGHTRIHTATVLGGDTRILITIRLVLPATIVLTTGTTILRHQIPSHGPKTTLRLPRDHPRRRDPRTIRPVMMRMMSRAVPFSQWIG